MRRLADSLATLSEVLAAALTAVVFGVMLAQIWFRYMLNDSLLWSEEVASWALIWLVFLGAVSVMRDWNHVRVPLVVDMMPGRVRTAVLIGSKLAVIGIAGIVAWLGFQTFEGGFHRMSPMLGLSTKWAKLAIPVGAALMAAMALASIAGDLRREQDSGEGR